MRIFVDTGSLRAFITPRDQFHNKTIHVLEAIRPQKPILITTDYILNETFTLLLTDTKAGYYRVRSFEEWFFSKRSVQIEWIDKQRFFKTKELFLKTSKDKLWSFTDCTSYVVMKELGINTAFSFDEHFKQMGFSLLS